jgi:lipopolysaccharide/colanic/teichoic acid biosynthesis glycosyltransferase
LVNVLRGEMSMVGPRPHLPYEVELYKDWHRRRLAGMPGITGWWQIHGRSRVRFDEAVRMDVWYLEHQSLVLDIRIMLRTLTKATVGRGAC